MFRKIKNFIKKAPILRNIYVFLVTRKYAHIDKKKYKMMHKNGLKAMSKINDVIGNYDCIFFFDMGTMLGAIRDHNFIGHDLDIDVAVVLNEGFDRREFSNYLVKSGFSLKYRYMIDNDAVEESYFVDGVKFDVNYYYINNDYDSCYLFFRYPDKEYPRETFDVVELRCDHILSTKMIDFLGIKIPVPSNPEHYLEQRYGPNWRIPDKNYIYWKGPSAIVVPLIGKCAGRS